MLILMFVFIGLVTGLLAGLLGIGGGVITVPALFFLFRFFDIPEEHLMHACVATALATTLLTSLGSTWAHHKKKAILFSVLKITAPGLAFGCLLGLVASEHLSSHAIQIIFGAMSVAFSVYFFFPKLPQLYIARGPNLSLAFFAMCIGALSTLLGVGGGIFMVPILLGYQISLPHTVANSSAGTLVTAGMGTILYLIFAPGESPLAHSIGYVNIPAMLIMGLSSICTTSLGCKLAHTLPHALTKKVFSLVLLITGMSMLF